VSGEAEKKEAWGRLVKGLRPTGFDPRALFAASPWRGPVLASREGRLDLTGFSLADPFARPVAIVGGSVVSRLSGVVELRSIVLKELDFSNARLPSLRLFDCVLENCVFRRAVCENWRMWGTTVRRCSFEEANLRGSALGTLSEGGNWRERNRFLAVSFDRADLRDTVWGPAEVRECSFRETRLEKVEFHGAVLEKCRFAGRLEQVAFHGRGFGKERFPQNRMQDVDFAEAEFCWVDFRGLDLDSVRWPEREDHLIFDDFHRRVDQVIAFVAPRADLESKAVRAVFEHMKRWSPAGQRTGVVNMTELADPDFAGPDLAAKIIQILRG